MTFLGALGFGLVMLSLGIFAGHAAGYARAMDVMKRRGAVLPRYRRVGRPD